MLPPSVRVAILAVRRRAIRAVSRVSLALVSLLLVVPGGAHAAALGNLWLIGDSITSGFTVAGGYRPALYTALTARGDTFRFVGSATNDSTALLNQAGQNHQEGHSGYAIATARNSNGPVRQGIYDNVTGYYNNVLTTQGRPDSIVLMIGTNDINANIDPANAPFRLGLLVDRILALDPTAHLFLASIAPARQGNTYIDPGVADLPAAIRTYNAAISGIVAQAVALGRNVSFVDIYSALSLSDLGSDGLHPSAAGYTRIGNAFAAALAVPEPAAAALWMSGFGIAAFASRRRRRVVPA